jgi:hypothetical protein
MSSARFAILQVNHKIWNKEMSLKPAASTFVCDHLSYKTHRAICGKVTLRSGAASDEHTVVIIHKPVLYKIWTPQGYQNVAQICTVLSFRHSGLVWICAQQLGARPFTSIIAWKSKVSWRSQSEPTCGELGLTPVKELSQSGTKPTLNPY